MNQKHLTPIAPLACAILFLAAGPAFAQHVVNWTPAISLPDSNPVGIANTQNLVFDPAAVITGLEVRLNLTGGWNGDLFASLVHDSGFTVLLNRPGNTGPDSAGSGSSGMNVTTESIHNGIPVSGFVTGAWQADARTADPSLVTSGSPRTAFLSSFNEAPVQGTWTLFLADNAAGDTSVLTGWGLTIQSEIRPFALWDSNFNSAGIGGAGTWSAIGGTWATSTVGTSTAAQSTSAHLVFDGPGGAVNVSGTVAPEAGLHFKGIGYSLSGGGIQLAGANPSANDVKVASGNSTSIGSILSGTGGLTKSGSGTLVLTGTNTYTGTTNLDQGTLVVNGSLSSGEVNIASGTMPSGAARLKGNGVIGGATTFAADPDGSGSQTGGIHSPGESVGKQNFTSDLTYSHGSIFEWEISATLKDSNTPGAARGTDWDAVNVAGSLTTTGDGAIFRVVLDGASTFANAFWMENRIWSDIIRTADAGSPVDYSAIFGGGFQHFNYGGVAGTLNELGDVSTYGSFTIQGHDLKWTAVPEPSGVLTGLLLSSALLRRKRATT